MPRSINKGLSLISDRPLHVLNQEYYEWAAKGKCRDFGETGNADLFFDAGEKYELAAKRICQQACPVVTECLEFALKYLQEGVWGGTTFEERRELRKRNRIQGIKLPTLDLSA